jgi:hypothetical protein
LHANPSLCVGSIEPAPSERDRCSSIASGVLVDNPEHLLSDSQNLAMPRGGSKPGERRGGRQKGSLNKLSIGRVKAQLAVNAPEFDPYDQLEIIAKTFLEQAHAEKQRDRPCLTRLLVSAFRTWLTPPHERFTKLQTRKHGSRYRGRRTSVHDAARAANPANASGPARVPSAAVSAPSQPVEP